MIGIVSLALIAVLSVPLIALTAVLLYLLLVGIRGAWWALKGD
ncbi:hypothetical protein [Ancylobacter sonchi]|nr:hypothetical protein [Ancylobacter sonchi]